MDNEYFRYLMKKKGFKVESLAKELRISKSQMNYKILNCKFDLDDIKKLKELFNMTYETIFEVDMKQVLNIKEA